MVFNSNCSKNKIPFDIDSLITTKLKQAQFYSSIKKYVFDVFLITDIIKTNRKDYKILVDFLFWEEPAQSMCITEMLLYLCLQFFHFVFAIFLQSN